MKLKSLLFSAFFALFAVGCVPHSSKFAPIELELVRDNPQGALEKLTSKKPDNADLLAYQLNEAMLLRINGEFAQSNDIFESAKQTIDAYDAISVSEQTASLVINDEMSAYSGFDFERVLIHFYSALNYLELGDMESARVEALQADILMNALDDGDYADDPAMRYLSGVIFESLRERSDAMIAYRKAYEAYKQGGVFSVALPNILKGDLLRLSSAVGLKEENSHLQDEFKTSNFAKLKKGEGEIVAVVSVGLAPIVRSENMLVPANNRMIMVALPRLEFRQRFGIVPALVVNGGRIVCERFYDVSALFGYVMKNNLPAITAKTVARAVAKELMAQAAGSVGDNKNASLAAKLLVQLFNTATEIADTRSWQTLPDEIYIARVILPSGTHDINVSYGDVKTVEYKQIAVREGQSSFLSPHFIPHYAVTR
ncbi:MAG: hypothetical protein LBE89_04025 [Helicobacteraceae bacterium]|jgi:hypothetical protein|nr:hypothetical protein [Helicobacteraceae bacterium]